MKIPYLLISLTAVVLALFLPIGNIASAQYADGLETDQPLFASHNMMTVRIEAPLTTLIRKKPEEEYLDGMFYYIDSAGQEQALDLKIRVRGKFRLKRETCNFPPIRLNFDKGQVKGTEFAGQDKLKLVSHCQANKKSFEQIVVREYLTYRMYQELTDKSFGARLMRITYVNTESDKKPVERYGFVIEDDDNIGDRIGMKPGTLNKIKSTQLDRKLANLVSVYEYLIGNTDFSLILGPAGTECCHNAVLYSSVVDTGPYTPIPYDFDFSGFVNAPYAAPNPRFKLRSVKTRLYRGRCMNNEYLNDTFAYFIEKEPVIRGVLTESGALDKKNLKDVNKFLDGFFKDISDPKLVHRKFITKCS